LGRPDSSPQHLGGNDREVEQSLLQRCVVGEQQTWSSIGAGRVLTGHKRGKKNPCGNDTAMGQGPREDVQVFRP